MKHIITMMLALIVSSGCGVADDGDTTTKEPECTLREHGIESPLEVEDMYGVWLLKSEPIDEQPSGFYYDLWTTEGVMGINEMPFWVDDKGVLLLGDPARPLIYANPVLVDEFTIRFNSNDSDEFTAYSCPEELTDVYIRH